MVQFNPIDFAQTNFFSALTLDYIAQKEQISPFSSFPNNELGIQQAIKQIEEYNYDRNILSNTLIKQYELIDYKEIVIYNINQLQQNNTFTIVTAHQPIILGGPLYFMIKIANAIKMAMQLNDSFPAYNFVPIYWMGSEDHDMEEIGKMNIFGKTLKWDVNQKGASGRMILDGFDEILIELKQILGESTNGVALYEIFENAYKENRTLKEATRIFVDAIFGKYGLVVVDGDDIAFKSLFAETISKEIMEQNAFTLVEQNSVELQKLGYKAQATPRPINFFYLGHQFRERIIWNEQNQVFEINNQNLFFSKAEMEIEILNNPQNFSPNVILRPVFQQTVLPALAFIGGGGEVSYWLQLKTVFEANHVFYPLILLRNSVQPIFSAQYKKWQKLGLRFEHIFDDITRLQTIFLQLNDAKTIDISEPINILTTAFNILNKLASEIDPNLLGVIGAEHKKTEISFQQIKQKLNKAQKAKFELQLQQIQNIKNNWFPNKNLWEREESFAALWLKFGQNIIDDFINKMNPLDGQFYLLVE